MPSKAIFFDRDGTLNELVEREDGRLTSPFSYDELEFTVTAKDAVMLARHNGFKTFIVTNQPHYGMELSPEDHAEIKECFHEVLHVDDYMFAKGSLKKPNPHMILTLARYHDVALNLSYTIGDRWKDIVAGAYAGTCTIFIGGPDKYTCPEGIDVMPDYYAKDVYTAVGIAVNGVPVDE